jgi:hypothetical protein
VAPNFTQLSHRSLRPVQVRPAVLVWLPLSRRAPPPPPARAAVPSHRGRPQPLVEAPLPLALQAQRGTVVGSLAGAAAAVLLQR